MIQATEFHGQGNKENFFLLFIASNKDLTNLSYAQWIPHTPSYFLFFLCILVGRTSLSIRKGFKVVTYVVMIRNF